MAFKGISQAIVRRESRLRHTFSAQRRLARPKSKLFTFHQEEAAARWSPDYPQKGPTKRPEDGALGLHKTPIYNTLAKAGQTGHAVRERTGPVSRRILHRDADAKRW